MWELDYKERWVTRIDAFELWCWRRLLRVPWTARRSNQSILKKISPGCSFIGRTDVEAETPILWPPGVKYWLIWKDPDAGKYWGQEEKGTTDVWMASPTQWTWIWVDPRSWWWTGKPGVLWLMGSQRVRHDWVTELNWTHMQVCVWLDSNMKFAHIFTSPQALWMSFGQSPQFVFLKSVVKP